MRNAFIATLQQLAQADPRVLVLTADNGAIVFDQFRRECPRQFLNCGISEATMMTAAAGLAACGKTPFVYTITTFLLMRAFEQVRNDVCLQDMNVKLVGIGGGVRYSTLGSTHHAIEDIAIMKVLPNLTILSPADPLETKKAVVAMKAMQGPVYLRMGTNKEPDIYRSDYEFIVGKGVVLNEGKDLSIIATGSILNEVLTATRRLERESLSVRVINLHTIKPIDRDIIIRAARETGVVLTVEEHHVLGGLGETVARVILEDAQVPVRFKSLGIPDTFCGGYGSHDYMKEKYGLGVENIFREAQRLCQTKLFSPL